MNKALAVIATVVGLATCTVTDTWTYSETGSLQRHNRRDLAEAHWRIEVPAEWDGIGFASSKRPEVVWPVTVTQGTSKHDVK